MGKPHWPRHNDLGSISANMLSHESYDPPDLARSLDKGLSHPDQPAAGPEFREKIHGLPGQEYDGMFVFIHGDPVEDQAGSSLGPGRCQHVKDPSHRGGTVSDPATGTPCVQTRYECAPFYAEFLGATGSQLICDL